MTDRERLIDLMIGAKRTEPETGSFTDYLADYLLEHGVIVLPCKIGDTVYRITQCSCEDIDGEQTECEFYGFGTDDRICELPNDVKCPYKLRVAGCNVTEMNIFMFAREWESVAFPTREEAEQALKEREDNG